MKNVYSLGTRNLQNTGFKLDIYYASDSLGTNITYLPEEGLKGKTLLQLLCMVLVVLTVLSWLLLRKVRLAKLLLLPKLVGV
jgi:hypothetical protein